MITSLVYAISAIILSYLLGAIPTSYIIARVLKGIDIRKCGSGNVGATNLMRVAGRTPGIIALLLDIIKGVIPVTVIAPIFYKQDMIISQPMFKIILGVFAVSGHIWTIFLNFSGGKGVATAIGVFIGLAPPVMTIALLIWAMVAFVSRYVSLSSLTMAASIPFLMVILGRPIEYIILSSIIFVLISYSHRSNIRRLIDGTEYKIGHKVKKK